MTSSNSTFLPPPPPRLYEPLLRIFRTQSRCGWSLFNPATEEAEKVGSNIYGQFLFYFWNQNYILLHCSLLRSRSNYFDQIFLRGSLVVTIIIYLLIAGLSHESSVCLWKGIFDFTDCNALLQIRMRLCWVNPLLLYYFLICWKKVERKWKKHQLLDNRMTFAVIISRGNW